MISVWAVVAEEYDSESILAEKYDFWVNIRLINMILDSTFAKHKLFKRRF